MNRLTRYIKIIDGYTYGKRSWCSLENSTHKIVEKLAEYENTGKEPQEIVEIIKSVTVLKKALLECAREYRGLVFQINKDNSEFDIFGEEVSKTNSSYFIANAQKAIDNGE